MYSSVDMYLCSVQLNDILETARNLVSLLGAMGRSSSAASPQGQSRQVQVEGQGHVQAGYVLFCYWENVGNLVK